MITIKDIARLANVAQSTVSKALNDRPDVSEATRKKVKEIALRYNFTPNAFGKGLKKRTTENIGVIFCREEQPLSGNPFYSRVLEGIEGEVALNNYNLVLHLIPEIRQSTLPKMVRERQIDGLVLVGTFQQVFVYNILAQHIPVVLIDPKLPVENCSQILIDNEHGALLATRYLIKRGHRRIAFISGDLERLSFKQRYNGYVKALKYHQLPLEKELIQTGGLEQGYEHVTTLLKLDSRPTAILAANDINAIYGYQAIREYGLRIPDDISVVGFDDIEIAKIQTPPLTTVRVYKEELGSIAIRTLLSCIKSPARKAVTTIVPVRLVERNSVTTIQSD